MIIPPEPQGPVSYRFRRGSKLADFPPVPTQMPVPPLTSFDGPFQLAEYLSLKVRHDPHDIKGLVDVPCDNAKAADKHVWIYEHLRRIPIDATPLITQLLQLCSHDSCPEMKADEWQYLCVAHGGEGTDRCCAIDYILHAVDSTTALLNSSNYFPSRLQIPHASLAHFPSLFRRLSRIFSHAYFHHREAFMTAEAETSLYARFVALCEKYELVGSNLLIIPQSGYEVMSRDDDDEDDDVGGAKDEEEEEEGSDGDKGSESTGDKGDKEDETAAPEAADSAADGPAGEHAEAAPADASHEGSPPPGDLLLRAQGLGRNAASYQSPGKWTTTSPVQPATKGKPAPAQASESLSPPSTRANLDTGYDEAATPVIPPGTKGKRGTLSRGKAPRGANLWTATGAEAGASEDASAATPTAAQSTDKDDAESPTIGMARKESVDSVVYVGKGDEAGPDDDGGSDEAALPHLPGEESATQPPQSPATAPAPIPDTVDGPTSTLAPTASTTSISPKSVSPKGASPKGASPRRVTSPTKAAASVSPSRANVSASAVSSGGTPPPSAAASMPVSTPAAPEPALPSAAAGSPGTTTASPRSELQARPGGAETVAVSPRGGGFKRGSVGSEGAPAATGTGNGGVAGAGTGAGGGGKGGGGGGRKKGGGGGGQGQGPPRSPSKNASKANAKRDNEKRGASAQSTPATPAAETTAAATASAEN